jgi:class 3 adenylate cyclase
VQTRTFLFADLRDYTKFVEHHGDAAAATLIGDYRRLVRAEVARHDGAEVKTEGDSFYVVFNSAQAALRCGMAMLREADRYSAERPDRPMKVGVGIHAGEPQPHEGQFVGEAVIVAARLAQQSGPGELLITEVARALLPHGAAPEMIEREDLPLKGIARAPRVYRVARPRADPAAVARPATETAVPAAAPTGAVVARELIGREAEVRALQGLLEEAKSGAGKLVLVAGEAGLGKSALVRRFLELARERRTTVMVGECTEIEARRPFGPVVDAFASAGLELPREFQIGAPGAQAVAEIDRYVVHGAFVGSLRELGARGAALFVLEDIHWADPATLELVEYLPRHLRSLPILIVATYRSDELHRRHPLNQTLAELDRSRLVTEIRLRPLDEDETARLISSALRLDRRIAETLASAIAADRGRDRGRALSDYGRCADLAERWTDWLIATEVRLRRARLLAAAGDLVAARAELDRFLPYWRKAKATWYLGEIEKKARAMGIEPVPA